MTPPRASSRSSASTPSSSSLSSSCEELKLLSASVSSSLLLSAASSMLPSGVASMVADAETCPFPGCGVVPLLGCRPDAASEAKDAAEAAASADVVLPLAVLGLSSSSMDAPSLAVQT